MRRRIVHSKQHGQAIPILGLTLLVLIGFAGLAVDGALAFAWRRNVTNSVDGAAMIATRALIVDRGSVTGADLNSAIETYLQTALDVPEPQFTLYYVRQDGGWVGGTQQPISSGSVPNNARGVVVEIEHTFNTYLMRVFGQPTLTVRANALARFGNSGTVSGEQIVPLALLPEAAERIRDDRNNIVIDLDGQIEERNAEIIAEALLLGLVPEDYPDWTPPDEFVPRSWVRAANLRMGDLSEPDSDAGATCGTATPAEIEYVWCRGTNWEVTTRVSGFGDQDALEAFDLIGLADYDSSLNGELLSRGFMDGRVDETIIVPVLAEAIDSSSWSPTDPVYIIQQFLAIRIDQINDGRRTIRVDYVPRYLMNGGLMGGNNNVELGEGGTMCEVCAVNLVLMQP
jgi:Flp pilus assembly protein TadG